jgi:hypothetical protein
MFKTATASAKMEALLERNRNSIEDSVGPVNHRQDSWLFDLSSNNGDRISVAIPSDTMTLEIFYKDKIYFSKESELSTILMQIKNGTFPIVSHEELSNNLDEDYEVNIKEPG